MAFEPKEKRGKWRACSATTIRSIWRSAAARAVLPSAWPSKHPDVNFIAVEREEGALIMQPSAASSSRCPIFGLYPLTRTELREVFAPGEVDRIYLNFSDPWPPNRQRKRRLTWRAYLEVYDEILRQQGDLCFKTDNQRFFEWSLQEICQFGWLIQNISLDLHNSDLRAMS
mgnify:CR=1 FL=1